MLGLVGLGGFLRGQRKVDLTMATRIDNNEHPAYPVLAWFLAAEHSNETEFSHDILLSLPGSQETYKWVCPSVPLWYFKIPAGPPFPVAICISSLPKSYTPDAKKGKKRYYELKGWKELGLDLSNLGSSKPERRKTSEALLCTSPPIPMHLYKLHLSHRR